MTLERRAGSLDTPGDMGAAALDGKSAPGSGGSPKSLWRRRPNRAHLPPRLAFLGAGIAVVLVVLLSAAMLPFRAHLSAATSALVLVVPVVVGVAIGGFGAGVIATASGFLAYDLVFLPPYNTLSVGAAQNWTALGVYAVVMVVVARLVGRATLARTDAERRTAELRRLFDSSELLVRESPLNELLTAVVTSVHEAFELEGVALLLPSSGRLQLMASAGEPLTDDELRRLSSSRLPVSLDGSRSGQDGVQVLALALAGEPVGLLALRGLPGTTQDHELLRAFANHLALALERSQLREQAVRSRLLEEVDRLRRSLVGAVSHDLRTPLATILVATSALSDPDAPISPSDHDELVHLVEVQARRLDRLVANLLDMTRIQSGALELRRRATSVHALMEEAIDTIGTWSDLTRIRWLPADDLPQVNVDPLLVGQVLVNLIDNALTYAPTDTPVVITATRPAHDTVLMAVEDHGPGISSEDRSGIFHMFNRREAGGRGGLGLAIAHAFVTAHDEKIWVDEAAAGGARFSFTLPVDRPGSRSGRPRHDRVTGPAVHVPGPLDPSDGSSGIGRDG